MVVGGSDEARPRGAALDARVQHVARADFQRRGIERLARVVIEHERETAELVVLERLDDGGGVLDGDRRAFFGDLQVVAAVGIALDALAEQQRDARVVDALVVAVPVAVAPKRNLARFDGIEACSRHCSLSLKSRVCASERKFWRPRLALIPSSQMGGGLGWRTMCGAIVCCAAHKERCAMSKPEP